jgi:hypothetical protein
MTSDVAERFLLLRAGSGRVELVEIGRGDRLGNAPRAEVFGMHVRAVRMHAHFAPFAPAALMAPIRLLLRHYLTEPFDGVPEP